MTSEITEDSANSQKPEKMKSENWPTGMEIDAEIYRNYETAADALAGPEITNTRVQDFLEASSELSSEFGKYYDGIHIDKVNDYSSTIKMYEKGAEELFELSERLEEGTMNAFNYGRLRDRLNSVAKHLEGRGEDTSGLKAYTEDLEKKRQSYLEQE